MQNHDVKEKAAEDQSVTLTCCQVKHRVKKEEHAS